MYSRLVRLELGLACCLLLSMVGCGGTHLKDQHTQADKGQKARDAAKDMPGKVTGTGWHIRWRTRADTTSRSIALPLMEADAQIGAMADQGAGNAVTAALDGVHARVFRDGIHTADIEAPHISANQQTHIVHGTGGITVHSLTNPPATVITADHFTWDVPTNRIFAEGNVEITRHPVKGPLFFQRGNRVTFDPKLNIIHMD